MTLIDLSRDIYHKMPRLLNHPSIVITPYSTHDEIRVADGYEFSSATMALALGDHAGAGGHQAEGLRAAAHGFLPPLLRQGRLSDRLSRLDERVGHLARSPGYRHVWRRGREPGPPWTQQFRGPSRLPRPRLHAHGRPGQSRQARRQGPLPLHRLPPEDQRRHG